MPNFRAIKVYYRNYVAGICRSYHESSDCFEYPKNTFEIKLPEKKNILAKILQPKKIRKLKISHPKKIHWSSLSLKIRCTPLEVGLLFGTWNSFSLFYFLNTVKSIKLACKCLSMVSLYWIKIIIIELLMSFIQ